MEGLTRKVAEPNRKRVDYLLLRAIMKSVIPPAKKLKCVDCGKQAQEYDHYLGYDIANALKVQPVCCSCHKKRSLKNGQLKGFVAIKYEGPRLKNGRYWSYAARHLQKKETIKRIGPRLKNGWFYNRVNYIGGS